MSIYIISLDIFFLFRNEPIYNAFEVRRRSLLGGLQGQKEGRRQGIRHEKDENLKPIRKRDLELSQRSPYLGKYLKPLRPVLQRFLLRRAYELFLHSDRVSRRRRHFPDDQQTQTMQEIYRRKYHLESCHSIFERAGDPSWHEYPT